jgi:small-conductance mechanosensitive channel
VDDHERSIAWVAAQPWSNGNVVLFGTSYDAMVQPLVALINNFVCGLILLFERPVKVGDIIQIDADLGEVQRIGIRACIIPARDGSEVIVPNGTIISNKLDFYQDGRFWLIHQLPIRKPADPAFRAYTVEIVIQIT